MTPDEHRDEAESLLERAAALVAGTTEQVASVRLAQVHATLANYSPPSPGVRQLQDENRVLRIQNSTLRAAFRDIPVARTGTAAPDRPKPGPPPNGGVRR